MNNEMLATRGNLMQARKTLEISKTGYDLMDKKRLVLINEIRSLLAKAENLQKEKQIKFAEAYKILEIVKLEMGSEKVKRLSQTATIEQSLIRRSKSVMGVEIARLDYDEKKDKIPFYNIADTSESLDIALEKFSKVKEILIELAVLETAVYRLATNIRKTQKRANSLKNITIPKYEKIEKHIEEALEENERDEFTRLKLSKKLKSNH